MKNLSAFVILALAALVVLEAGPAFGSVQSQADTAPILGTWNLEIYADGQSIFLTLILSEAEGELSGRMSEQMGMFTDAPLKNIRLEERTLVFDITVPSPPDGMERTWTSQFAVGEDTLEGTISNVEVGISAVITGKREKK